MRDLAKGKLVESAGNKERNLFFQAVQCAIFHPTGQEWASLCELSKNTVQGTLHSTSELCLKTERTRTQTAWGKSTVLHFCLLDKSGLEESIRLLCVTWVACLCVRKMGRNRQILGDSYCICAREANLTCLMSEGLKLSFKQVKEPPSHKIWNVWQAHCHTWRHVTELFCSLQPATPTHTTQNKSASPPATFHVLQYKVGFPYAFMTVTTRICGTLQ